MKNGSLKLIPFSGIVVSFLLVATCHCCFGQTDTNLIATGDWSKAVTDQSKCALRGRLLVYNDEGSSAANHARIYLELQHVVKGGWDNPVAFYYANDLQFEMRDAAGRSVPQEPVAIDCLIPDGYWVTLPCDATVRLRADMVDCGQQPKPNDLEILVHNAAWLMKPGVTSDFFLSATFVPSTNSPAPMNYPVWRGTLELPATRIPAGSQ
jgi:hypothetical protein